MRTIDQFELVTSFTPPASQHLLKEWMEGVWQHPWLIDPQRIATPLRKFPEYRVKGSGHA